MADDQQAFSPRTKSDPTPATAACRWHHFDTPNGPVRIWAPSRATALWMLAKAGETDDR